MYQKTFLLFILLIFTNSSIISQNIFVSENGNDNNTGSIDNPYKTFSKAISVMSPGDICTIMGGTYEEELLVNKSGTQHNYLIFKAADGEKVNIKSTTKVNGWQLHSGNIYKTQIDMNIESRFRAVYHNENYMDLARWPNNSDNNRWTIDCVPVTAGDGSHFTADNIPNIDWSGGLVYYLGAHSGASWTRSIESSTTNKINYTSVDINKWPFNPHNPTVWRDYPNNNRGQLYLFNKLEALDYSREWYYDSSSKTLYFQAPDNNIPAENSVEIAVNKFAAQLNGDYIKVEGIHFFGGSVKIKGDNNIFQNNEVIHGSEGHDSLNNTGASVGEAAIEVLGGNTLIKGCTINHSSVNGITVQNWSGAHNSIIEENYISNIDYVGIHATPIRSTASDVKILKNTIVNSGRDGMYVNGLNCEIAYNDVSKAELINADSGVFYTVGNDALKNTEIHHNWFHDSSGPSYSHAEGESPKAAGIYLDNNSKGYIVHHNAVWNVSWTGYQVNWNNTHLDFFHNTIWNASDAMGAWVNGYTQENNKVYNNFANTGTWFSETATDFDIKDNLITSESPFEDAQNQNFIPKAGSEVLDNGRIISGFDKVYIGGAPDIGAYERGGTNWTAGVNAIEDTGEAIDWTIFDTQFSILATSETCPNKENGIINITADISGDYVINFNETESDFNKNISFENIKPGSYELCIALKDDDTLSQCFSIEIKEAAQLASKISVDENKINITINEGTAPFKVIVNDEFVFETSATSFSLDINHSDIVKVNSSIKCEGEIVESINLLNSITSYPNPTNGDFQLRLPIDEGVILVEIYNIQSQLVYSNVHTVISGKVALSLENNPTGVYFAKIVSNNNTTSVKIIKN